MSKNRMRTRIWSLLSIKWIWIALRFSYFLFPLLCSIYIDCNWILSCFHSNWCGPLCSTCSSWAWLLWTSLLLLATIIKARTTVGTMMSFTLQRWVFFFHLPFQTIQDHVLIASFVKSWLDIQMHTMLQCTICTTGWLDVISLQGLVSSQTVRDVCPPALSPISPSSLTAK